MNLHSHVFNNIYLLKEGVSREQIVASFSRCLGQAEALANIISIVDTEAVDVDTVNYYLWALSNMIQEARWLSGYLIDQL